MSAMGIEEILKYLPHRYPFLMVDRVLSLDEKRIVAEKNVTINEPFFQGHFPGNPIMPGVLQLEALAQVGGILLNKTQDLPGRIAYFLGIDNAKFRRMVKPGDILRFEVDVLRIRLGICKIHGKVFVGDEVSCEADLKFGGTQ